MTNLLHITAIQTEILENTFYLYLLRSWRCGADYFVDFCCGSVDSSKVHSKCKVRKIRDFDGANFSAKHKFLVKICFKICFLFACRLRRQENINNFSTVEKRQFIVVLYWFQFCTMLLTSWFLLSKSFSASLDYCKSIDNSATRPCKHHHFRFSYILHVQ